MGRRACSRALPKEAGPLPAFWLLHCAKCSTGLPLSAWGCPWPGCRTQATGASGRSPQTPGSRQPSPPSTWASYTLLAPVRTARTHDSPGGRCPTRWAPQTTTLPLLHLPRLCRGKGLSLKQAPAHFLGLPQGKEPLANPKTWLLPPQHTAPPALHRRAVSAGAARPTLSFLAKLLPQANLGVRGKEQGYSSAPWLFWGWGWCLWGYRSQVPSSTAPKGTGRPSSLYPPLPHLGYPTPTPSLAEVKRGPYPESPASQPGPLGTGEVWAKAVGVSGRKKG